MENIDRLAWQDPITKENLPIILTQIGIEREKKGTSELLIPHIREVREQAEKLGEKSTVLQLYQEEFLSAQHMIMEEKAKGLKANSLRAAKGMFIIEQTSKTMERYAEKNAEDLDPVVSARVFRFLGRYADHKGQYKKSKEYYRKGLIFFDQTTKPEDRCNRLEFLGFLSFSLIKQDKTEEGIGLVQQTLKDFDESIEGIWLKENDYYTWAVWKSGIEIRTAEHVIKTKDSQHADLAKNFLSDSENILKMPDGTTESFRLRRDELDATKDLINKIKL